MVNLKYKIKKTLENFRLDQTTSSYLQSTVRIYELESSLEIINLIWNVNWSLQRSKLNYRILIRNEFPIKLIKNFF